MLRSLVAEIVLCILSVVSLLTEATNRPSVDSLTHVTASLWPAISDVILILSRFPHSTGGADDLEIVGRFLFG
uniref:Putative secreted protein n=1 Tax=Panstrongylus lignarius TaxID=156445 RepID=A0A224Y4D0_9HEMI